MTTVIVTKVIEEQAYNNIRLLCGICESAIQTSWIKSLLTVPNTHLHKLCSTNQPTIKFLDTTKIYNLYNHNNIRHIASVSSNSLMKKEQRNQKGRFDKWTHRLKMLFTRLPSCCRSVNAELSSCPLAKTTSPSLVCPISNDTLSLCIQTQRTNQPQIGPKWGLSCAV